MNTIRPAVNKICIEQGLGLDEATATVLRDPKFKTARCGEHVSLIQLALRSRGFPNDRMCAVGVTVRGADHEVLLVSPAGSFGPGEFCPPDGVFIIDTWAAEPFKLTFAANVDDMCDQLDNRLHQVKADHNEGNSEVFRTRDTISMNS